MIFVTVGTDRFDKLVRAADKLAKEIKEEVIIQKGNSQVDVQHAKSFNFTNKIDKYFSKARLVISHGGAATTYELLKKGKKVISLANLDRTDVHQTEILEQLSKEGYLVWHKNTGDFVECVKKSSKFKPKKYNPPKCTIADKISEFIEKSR